MLSVNNRSCNDMLDMLIKMILICNIKGIVFKQEHLQSQKTMLKGLWAFTFLGINSCQGNSKFSLFSSYSIVAPQDAVKCLVHTFPGKRKWDELYHELSPKQQFLCSSMQKQLDIRCCQKSCQGSPSEFEDCSLQWEEFIGHLTAVCSALKG